MRIFKLCIQIVFYILILALFISRAASAGFSHDENQFIASGQFLADHRLLPYVDYPYTHMPYATGFYAVTAAMSDYDFLAGRLLNAATWALCTLFITWNIRFFSRLHPAAQASRDDVSAAPSSDPSFPQLLAEFVLALVFLYHPAMMGHIDGPALNHSYATLFGLVVLLLFGIALQQRGFPRWLLFWSGIFAGLAAFTRLNYAALAVVLLLCLILYIVAVTRPRRYLPLIPPGAGLLLASIPTAILAILAPAHFFYGNIVYVRLNTAYYSQLAFRLNMTMSSKFQSFAGSLLHSPIDIILYAGLAVFGVWSLYRFLKTRSVASIADLALTGFALVLALSAFAPTPTQPQYFFAPLPFMLVILGILGTRLGLGHPIRWISASLLVLLALFATLRLQSIRVPNPLSELGFLSRPSQWTPVQMHAFDESLRGYVPDGRILALVPMLPLEAGYGSYPFTATGTFSWRTSLLLTPARRLQYGVTSPEELPQLLQANPPSGILTSLESTNDGFVRNDLGGLETPFVDYAKSHGYKPIPLRADFLRRTVTLWVKPP
jgi:hypothetical protein